MVEMLEFAYILVCSNFYGKPLIMGFHDATATSHTTAYRIPKPLLFKL